MHTSGMQFPTIGHYYTVFDVSACSLGEGGRDARRHLSVLENGELKNGHPARIRTV